MQVIQYNPYNTEALFKTFLSAEKISAISLKNYLSDIRHFFGWLTFRAQSQIEIENIDKKNIIGLISLTIIEEYKSYLIDNNVPLKTVNRRLSTLRKFCSFCISQGWMKENPAKKIKNQISKIKTTNQILNIDLILSEFEQYISKNEDSIQDRPDISDIREFISLTSSILKFQDSKL